MVFNQGIDVFSPLLYCIAIIACLRMIVDTTAALEESTVSVQYECIAVVPGEGDMTNTTAHEYVMSSTVVMLFRFDAFSLKFYP